MAASTHEVNRPVQIASGIASAALCAATVWWRGRGFYRTYLAAAGAIPGLAYLWGVSKDIGLKEGEYTVIRVAGGLFGGLCIGELLPAMGKFHAALRLSDVDQLFAGIRQSAIGIGLFGNMSYRCMGPSKADEFFKRAKELGERRRYLQGKELAPHLNSRYGALDEAGRALAKEELFQEFKPLQAEISVYLWEHSGGEYSSALASIARRAVVLNPWIAADDFETVVMPPMENFSWAVFDNISEEAEERHEKLASLVSPQITDSIWPQMMDLSEAATAEETEFLEHFFGRFADSDADRLLIGAAFDLPYNVAYGNDVNRINWGRMVGIALNWRGIRTKQEIDNLFTWRDFSWLEQLDGKEQARRELEKAKVLFQIKYMPLRVEPKGYSGYAKAAFVLGWQALLFGFMVSWCPKSTTAGAVFGGCVASAFSVSSGDPVVGSARRVGRERMTDRLFWIALQSIAVSISYYVFPTMAGFITGTVAGFGAASVWGAFHPPAKRSREERPRRAV